MYKHNVHFFITSKTGYFNILLTTSRLSNVTYFRQLRHIGMNEMLIKY